VLLLPVWALGIVRGERITRAVGTMPPFFGEDLARFERLRPHLAGTEKAILLVDRTHAQSAAERFFAAQSSLAPTLLSWPASVAEIVGGHWLGEPRIVLCAMDDGPQRATALAALEAAARRRGLSYSAEPVDAVLTLVRLGGD
jgi:hypothetical protein